MTIIIYRILERQSQRLWLHRLILYAAVDGTISVLLFDSLPIISIALTTFSSSVPMIKVVLPALRNPLFVAGLVTNI